MENTVIEKQKQIEKLASEISRLETKVSEKVDSNISVLEIRERIDNFEEKAENGFKAMEKMLKLFAKDMDVFSDHINDFAVEVNDDIGNLTEAWGNTSMDLTFKNPFLMVKCDLCEFIAKSEKGLKTHWGIQL